MRIIVCIFIMNLISIQVYCQERWEESGIFEYSGKLKLHVYREDTAGRNLPDQTLLIEDGRIIEYTEYKLTGVYITKNVYQDNQIIEINKFKNYKWTESYRYDYYLPDSLYVYRSINMKDTIRIERTYFKDGMKKSSYNDVFNTKIEWNYSGDTLISEYYFNKEDSLTCSKRRKLKDDLIILEKYSCQDDFEILNEYYYDQNDLIRLVTTSSKIQDVNESVIEIYSYSKLGQLEEKDIILQDKQSIQRVFYEWEFFD